MKHILIIAITIIFCHKVYSHEQSATATYLGNEAIMITDQNLKIVFDPFFHNNYNTYQLVPEEIRTAIFTNKSPYDNINAIFISHAHGDHFAADDMLKYLKEHPKTKLIAPDQAIDKLWALDKEKSVIKQTTSINLKLGDQPKIINLNGLLVEAVRIPHAGWPGRKDISNLVFRITLNDSVTVMHMGDADPNDLHFKPYKEHWEKSLTNTAFPPYWFFDSTYGPKILKERINAEKSVGIHVPSNVPESLKATGQSYFSKPGQQQDISHKHK